MDIIQKTLDKPWEWWYGVSYNLFTKDKEMFMAKKYKEHIAAFRIQQYYARGKYVPIYAYCRRLHMKFYYENSSYVEE
jgi:hypothetical protein